ncbi:MAG: sugar transferase [Candidatus Omnitrophica bacterium]|nr:sugar transferase [Candidatus Omnitrophota bacterium]
MERNSGVIKILLAALAVMVIFAGATYAEGHKAPGGAVPEVNSMFLIFMGIAGAIVRFVRIKFILIKKAFDLISAVIGIVLLAPVIAVVAAYIKIVSPGPVIFKQERVGKDGKVFMMYKMRTMRVDAEGSTGPVWAKKNDSRMIKGGSIIRKIHVDEFPQLINVLKGDMSIIGPRPERPVFVDSLSKEIVDYRKRLAVKPGITGLAQVWHKYDESIKDVRKKVKYDILYIRKMCVLTDMGILLRTLIVAALGKGAI